MSVVSTVCIAAPRLIILLCTNDKTYGEPIVQKSDGALARDFREVWTSNLVFCHVRLLRGDVRQNAEFVLRTHPLLLRQGVPALDEGGVRVDLHAELLVTQHLPSHAPCERRTLGLDVMVGDQTDLIVMRTRFTAFLVHRDLGHVFANCLSFVGFGACQNEKD